ncbi:unnamed protein product [Larinioides sclopetarius]|uniref:Uncharacterized protein n=1 Tax=Larinioides sclopetarius TaxID=280406 RepID=A0AAV1ZDZ7_9ARAC
MAIEIISSMNSYRIISCRIKNLKKNNSYPNQKKFVWKTVLFHMAFS